MLLTSILLGRLLLQVIKQCLAHKTSALSGFERLDQNQQLLPILGHSASGRNLDQNKLETAHPFHLGVTDDAALLSCTLRTHRTKVVRVLCHPL